MKKGVFIISDYSFSQDSVHYVGVHKKIISQVEALNNLTGECKLVNFFYDIPKNKFVKMVQLFFSNKLYDRFIQKEYDYIYVRRLIPVNAGFISFLKKMKKANNKIVIIYEIPTYPYDIEMKENIKSRLVSIIDKYYRNRLKLYVDYISTYTKDEKIFNIKTINIINGIDCKSIPLAKTKKNTEIIDLITVAQFSFWHGYDRLLNGIKEYYQNKQNKRIIRLTMVGDGPEVAIYKEFVKQNNLSECVIFAGKKSGKELDKLFDDSDIAINSLGCHRKKIFISSELKSREYIARGLPLIGSTKVDIIPNDWKYILYFPEDESSIKITEIIDFYDRLREKESFSNIRNNIRKFCEEKCDMKIVMKRVVEYI